MAVMHAAAYNHYVWASWPPSQWTLSSLHVHALPDLDILFLYRVQLAPMHLFLHGVQLAPMQMSSLCPCTCAACAHAVALGPVDMQIAHRGPGEHFWCHTDCHASNTRSSSTYKTQQGQQSIRCNMLITCDLEMHDAVLTVCCCWQM